jgi:hypothetical protein
MPRSARQLVGAFKYMIKNCLVCGKEFVTYPYWIKRGLGKFCSRVCSGKNHDRRVKRHCLNCKKQFITNACEIKKGWGKFCCHKCYWNSLIIGRTNNREYILIRKPEHPFANSRGYIMEHRLIAEKFLKRYLLPEETIHHINENCSDNRIENLYLFPTIGKHFSYHRSNAKMILTSNIVNSV